MNAKELFGLIVRVIGLLAIIYVGRRIIKIGAWEPLHVVRIVSALVGVYMLRGAPLLLKFAYPEKTAEVASTPG